MMQHVELREAGNILSVRDGDLLDSMANGSRVSKVSEAKVSYTDCAIYVDAQNRSDLVDRLASVAHGGEAPGVLRVGPMHLAVAHNDYATARAAGSGSGFLQWEFVVECEASPGAGGVEVVAAVTVVLETLWRAGYRAVAACDFEDELPAGSKMRRPLVPSAAAPATEPRWKRLVAWTVRKKGGDSA
ncbi:hypothetical protein ABZ070_24235 [Streptomyces sp. NPDC006283]|uniref:hypothetical protein n=1 Tax=Streptomyces sp. NPDC006283 TaxID=3156741 RepID=UPI0033B025E4